MTRERAEMDQREALNLRGRRDPTGVGAGRMPFLAVGPRVVEQVIDAAGELCGALVVRRVRDDRERIADPEAGGGRAVTRLSPRRQGEPADLNLSGAELLDPGQVIRENGDIGGTRKPARSSVLGVS